jgi:DNA mismatch repair protein MutS
VAEHLHDRIGCKTLFATHYHELCALERARPRVRNFSTAVREHKDEIVFLHKLVPGGASRSYGIQVARLAGIDRGVIARAREIVVALERGEELGPARLPEGDQLSLLGTVTPVHEPSAVERALAEADLDGMSPREALAFLAELQARLSK